MIQTSNNYKNAIYAPTRHCKGKVRFEILDTSAFTDNTSSVTGECSISRKEQLTNKVRVATSKYATLEKDYLRLDGSFTLSSEGMNSEIGWWSEKLSNEQGVFSPCQVLEFKFTKVHSSAGLILYFDILNNEYASDFDIDIFDSSDTLISHESITDNKKATFIYAKNIANYKKIKITIKKWCKPFRRVKITEVDFGIIKEYTDSNLIKMNTLQEMKTTSESLPADELKFTIDNSNGEFDMLNPKGFYGFLQQGQECFCEIGVELPNKDIEYIKMGKYYIKSWQSNEGSMTASFTARGILDTINYGEVENKTARDITLYDLAIEVMNNCNIEEYKISENLKFINTKGVHGKKTYKTLLQLIAIAGMCVVYSDNLGVLHIKQLVDATTAIDSINVTNQASISDKEQVLNKVLKPSFNISSFEQDRFVLDGSCQLASADMSSYEVGWWSDELSNDKGVFTNPLTVTLNMSKDHSSKNIEFIFDTINNEYAKEFELKVYDISSNVIINETIQNENNIFCFQDNRLENCRKIELIINKWSNSNRRARIIEIAFDAPVDNLTLDNIYKVPQINIDDTVKSVEVTYYPTDNTKATYTATNTAVKKGKILKLDNSLINSEQDAKNVAEWILKEKNNTAKFTVNWRQNPALTLSDKIRIQSFDKDNVANVVKQEYSYQGYLKGKTTAKGAI